jgi:hypothetical protein
MGVLANFFAEKPRCYSRQTTAMLTDFAGLAVILFLAFYFATVGALFYNEIVVHGAKL